MNVTEQIADIRERLARVETILIAIQENAQKPVKREGIFIPVAVMVMIGQGAFALVQHFF
jgi:hypothetical protein